MRDVTAVITGVGRSNTLCMTPSMRKRMGLVAARLQMDIRRALVERVLQQPVDDVHDVAIVHAELAGLAELDELFEVEQRAAVVEVALGVLGALGSNAARSTTRRGSGSDVQRIGNDTLDVLAQHVRKVGDPARIERFGRREHDLHRAHRDRQDAVAVRIGVADDLRHRVNVDLHRIDLHVRQCGAARAIASALRD